MAQAPPSRPWFRLATMRAPPPAPAPAPAPTPTPAPAPAPAPAPPTQPSQGPPPPRPPIIRTFTQATPPPQPTPTPPPPQQPIPTPTQQPTPTPSLPRPTPTLARAINVVEPPRQPTPPPSSSPSGAVIGRAPPPVLRTATVPTRAVSPPSSPPKTIKPLDQTPPRASSPPPRSLSPPKRTQLIFSPPSSPPRAPLNQITTPPEPSSTMHPPSPLQLPSLKQTPYDEGTQEYTQKAMLVQETKEKPKTSAHTGFNARHIGGFNTHNNNNSTRKPETLKKHLDSEDAGKNIITIAGENKGAIMNITPFGDKKQDFGKKVHFNRNNPNTLNDSETDSDAKNNNQNSNSPLKTSFLNSNVQGVNNSILFNCSINHHDPGIHLTLSTKPDRDLDTGNHSKRALL